MLFNAKELLHMISSPNVRVFKMVFAAAAAIGAVWLLAPRDAVADGPPVPPEAYAACQSKKAGDACTVSFRGREMNGTCAEHPSDGKLACRPAGPPGPPPEAFDACNGKKADDACTVSFHGREMSGTCRQTPDSRLVCAPPHPPGPPSGDGPPR